MTDLRIKICQTQKTFLNQIQEDLKLYHNIQNILLKIDNDGMLELLRQGINKVLDNEIAFAVKKLSQIETQNKTFQLKSQIKRNTMIFKENLKVIVSMLSKLKSRKFVDFQNKRRKYYDVYY